MKRTKRNGFTLIELMVSVGLFALVATLASGAYLVMIGVNQQVQGIATGINNLSFALESMTRDIRTGTNYSCPTPTSDCIIDASPVDSFSFTDVNSVPVAYSLSASTIQRTMNNLTSPLTDSSVSITSLTFHVSGTKSYSNSGNTDTAQPYVTIVVVGTVTPKAGKAPIQFNVETSAAMRGTDL